MLRLSLFRQGPTKKNITVFKTPSKKVGLMKILSNYQSPKENFEKTFDLKNEMMATCISDKSSDHIDSDDEGIKTASFGANTQILKVLQQLESSTRQSSSPNSCADIESGDDESQAAEVSNFVENKIEFSNSKIRMTELITPKSTNQKTPVVKIDLNIRPQSSVREYIFEENEEAKENSNPTMTFEDEVEECPKNENIIVISQNDFVTIPTISEDLISNLSWDNAE